MATMVSEVYEAFVEAGASQDKARKAAEAMAAYEDRHRSSKQESATEFQKIDQRFNQVDQRLTKVDGELTLLKWMVGANTAVVVAILVKLLFP